MTKHHRHPMQQPWGLATGLLAGCVITLIGVLLDLQPDTILLRALLGGSLIGGLTSVVVRSCRAMLPDGDD